MQKQTCSVLYTLKKSRRLEKGVNGKGAAKKWNNIVGGSNGTLCKRLRAVTEQERSH